MPTAWAGPIVATVTPAIGLALLLRAWPQIRHTTLASAWSWTLAALLAWSGAELLAARSAASTNSAALRLLAVALSLCPAVSVIGAKRPQHAAWNFIVLSLWAIVALPAAETFFLHPGQRLSVGDARAWFLWVLILLSPINFVPTRYWLASLLVAAGQVLALSQYLALVQRPLVPLPEACGLALCGLGVVAAALAARRSNAADPRDRWWLDFRNSFGLFWALRVQERMNATAVQHGWNIELTWSGFRQLDSTESAVAAVDEPAVRSTLKGLLRRFVTAEWIAQRAGQSLD